MTIKTPAHYVKGNQTCRVPRRWVYLDTEAHLVGDQFRHEQFWRLGVTTFEHRDNTKRQWTEPETRHWTDSFDMWDYIASCTKPSVRTVVVAHNIGYDLRISDALSHLVALGWELVLMSIGGRNLTMTWRKDKATMILADFVAWIPRKLADIGVMVGVGKLPMPSFDDPDSDWFPYCERDVEVLRLANREVIEWIERDDLGNWQRTGASMAYANWRHRHLEHRVLVHADELAREYEVVATGAARCEAWQHGKLREGRYTEWDLPMAYPGVCLTAELPTSLIGHHWAPQWSSFAKRRRGERAILTATVTTDHPVLCVKSSDGWLWPTGTFTSSWWEDELHLATSLGATVQLHHAVTYKATPALVEWAKWVTGVVNDAEAPYTPVQRAVAKHWSRALIGRFGARFPLWELYGEARHPGIELGGFYDADTDELGQMLTLGGQCYIGYERDWVADAAPAIMGAVMAECRIRLWRILEVAGFDNVVYCDTDSVIVTPAGDANLRSWIDTGHGWGLRVKGHYKRLQVMGPRQMVLDGHGRISGLPRDAQLGSDGRWIGERWDGVAASLTSGKPDTVVVRNVEWTVAGVDRRRAHLEDHRTAAVQVHP